MNAKRIRTGVYSISIILSMLFFSGITQGFEEEADERMNLPAADGGSETNNDPINNGLIQAVAPERGSNALSEETIADAQIISDLINIKAEQLPKATEEKSLAKHEVEAEDKSMQEQEIREKEASMPEEVSCISGPTDYLAANSFNCNQVFTKEDNKAVPLYTGIGKRYAAIEAVLPVESERTLLQIKHSVEFPTQQDISVFYLEDNIWKGVCHNMKTSRQGSVSTCDLVAAVEGKSTAALRVEAYAREGKAVWLVDDIRMVQNPAYTLKQSSNPGAGPIPPVRLDDPHIVVQGAPALPLEGENENGGNGNTGTDQQLLIFNGGFRGQYPTLQSPNTGFQGENEQTQSEIIPSQSAPLETVVIPDGEGFLSLTGRAIADLARKNPFGAVLTLLVLGLVIFGLYRFSRSYR